MITYKDRQACIPLDRFFDVHGSVRAHSSISPPTLGAPAQNVFSDDPGLDALKRSSFAMAVLNACARVWNKNGHRYFGIGEVRVEMEGDPEFAECKNSESVGPRMRDWAKKGKLYRIEDGVYGLGGAV